MRHLLHMKSCFLCIALISLLACGSPTAPQQDATPSQVSFDPKSLLVSFDARNTPVKTLLTELSKQARLSVHDPNDQELGRITLSVKNMPLDEALAKLLAGKSYQLTYNSQTGGGKVLAGIDLTTAQAKSETAGRQTTAAKDSPEEAKHSGFAWGNTSLLQQRLANATGQPQDVALAVETLSLDTVKQLIGEADPTQRVAMLDAMRGRDDAEPVQPLFLNALQDGNADVREAAIDYLQSAYDPLPMAPLADLVRKETNPELRIEALSLLADQMSAGDRTREDLALAVSSANRALTDPNPDVRDQAEMTLEELSRLGQPSKTRKRF